MPGATVKKECCG